MDAADPLAAFVDRFVIADPGLCYLDGNSLGRLPQATAERLARFVEEEWGGLLVEGWERWIDLPTEVGDELGRVLLGAGPGQVALCDSVTVNLYKLASAALGARPDRHVVVMAEGEFPTDSYVIQGLAGASNGARGAADAGLRHRRRRPHGAGVPVAGRLLHRSPGRPERDHAARP